MEIDLQIKDFLLRAVLRGRIDAFGARRCEEELIRNIPPDIMVALLDFADVSYLSSAGLRVLLQLGKELQRRRGSLALVKVSPYCQGIIRMSGFDRLISQFQDMDEAVAFCTRQARAKVADNRWDRLERLSTGRGEYRFIPGDAGAGKVEIVGSFPDILHAGASLSGLHTRKLSETKYSLGIGGLGERPEDFLHIMGETVTVNGKMGWLPSDGHGMADIIVPQNDSDEFRIHTAFNITIADNFHESAFFHALPGTEVSVASLYRDLFDIARGRRPGFKGAIAVAMRARMGKVLGSALKKSPLSVNAPSDGKMITHPFHIAGWFEIDKEPRHRDVTALIVGVGADLTCDLSAYGEPWLDRALYMPPSNADGRKELLRNHAMIFSGLPVPERPVDLAHEIEKAVAEGEFMDMRCLLDVSTIESALIGISYIDGFRPDSRAVPAAEAAGIPPATMQQINSYRKAATTEKRLTGKDR